MIKLILSIVFLLFGLFCCIKPARVLRRSYWYLARFAGIIIVLVCIWGIMDFIFGGLPSLNN